ncbi:glycerophosphodiester phosphodiesterase family protein [Glutamicibacter sp.]|uniref:glycerophosphodiester phosphodiesterase n=1 Tax=Glutamicibacter sp. TaxID=1931995 RepID=UPI0028BD154E|nr:glycerophosphodiester phosphodiesterase family protein [Glutamicibacter sp.]
MDTLFYAHRGSSHKFSENTRAAYLQAIDEGADGIECDVHLSKDGIVVCHHDPTVDRTSDSTGLVASRTLEELKALDFTNVVPSVIPEQYGRDNEQLLSLAELLHLIDTRGVSIGLAVEIKHPSPFGHLLEDGVLKVLHDFNFDPQTGLAGRNAQISVTLMSFEPESLRYLARTVNKDLLCQLITEVDGEWVEELLSTGQVGRAAVYEVLYRSVAEGIELINAGGAGIIGPGVAWTRANEHLVRQWLGQGLKARIWTVDRPADALYLTKLGVGQLTSNRPAELRRELELN